LSWHGLGIIRVSFVWRCGGTLVRFPVERKRAKVQDISARLNLYSMRDQATKNILVFLFPIHN